MSSNPDPANDFDRPLWLKAYSAGADLREAGEVGGISHQEVSNRLHELGIHVRTQTETRQLRLSLAVQEHGDAIEASFLAKRNLEAAAADVGVSRQVVEAAVRERVPDFQVLTRVPRSVAKRHTTDELLTSLREAAGQTAGILSTTAYKKFVMASPALSDGRARPGPQTAMLRFGGWNDALQAAGLPTNPKAGPAKKFDDPASVLQSVVTCWVELQRPPTGPEYDLWQRGKDVHPSPSIVRRILGSWNTLLIRAWQIVHDVQLDQDDADTAVPPGVAHPTEFVPYSRPNEDIVLLAATEAAKSNLAALQTAVRAHSKLQNMLADALRQLGVTPLSPGATEVKFDLAFKDEGGALVVAEVKSCTPTNLEGQLRLGLGQVLRYAHQLRQRHAEVHALLVLQQEPPAEWKLLLKDLDVEYAHQGDLVAAMRGLLKAT